jgi:hypothetical protein
MRSVLQRCAPPSDAHSPISAAALRVKLDIRIATGLCTLLVLPSSLASSLSSPPPLAIGFVRDPLPPMHLYRATLAVLPLLSLVSSAPSFDRRQVLTTLDVSLGSLLASPVYVSTSTIFCEPYKVTFNGRFPDFEIDVVSSGTNSTIDGAAGATSLAALGTWGGNEKEFMWRPDLDVGTRFFLHIRDSRGNERTGFEHWVVNGTKEVEQCRCALYLSH